MTAPRFCAGCGGMLGRSGCDGACTGALDPLRYCGDCGRRLVVRVFPAHVESRCPAGCAGPAEVAI